MDSGSDPELAWSEFLHEFFRFKASSFFEEPSPNNFSPQHQALLSAVAEWLSEQFELPVPTWVHDPRYTLSELWDPLEELLPDAKSFREERISKSDQVFLKRNVIFDTRSLISL